VSNRLLTNWLGGFRRTIAVREASEVTDGDLLQRFSRDRDETAFATLMERHGPLVLGVCRRVLHDPNDADDAFQATFFVLARKAGLVGQPDRLANWLHGVALRVAQKAWCAAARRQSRQQQVTDMPGAESSHEAEWTDLCQVLDEEVQRLPEKFRLPILLCYLEGKTREEAAEQLGWKVGAVKGMLERGRELLRSRLIRRGVTLTATSLAGLLSQNALSAAVPVALSDSTIRAAVLFAAGKATAAESAAALAEGMLQAMWISRLKVAVAVILVVAAVGSGAGAFALGSLLSEPEAPQKAGPAVNAGPKAEQRKRQAARADLAKAAFEGYLRRFEAGVDTEQTVNLWSRRWLQAQLALSDRKADRDAALQAHLYRLKKVDEIARARPDQGASPQPVQLVENELKSHETLWQQFMKSKATPEQVCHASARLLMAQLKFRKELGKRFTIKDANVKPHIDALGKEMGFDLLDEKSEFLAHRDRIKKVEAITKARAEAGMLSALDSDTVAFHRLQAEEWLAQGQTFTEAVLNPGGRLKK
jgi:RNA polymerase sigma factor (sigma-70 family)